MSFGRKLITLISRGHDTPALICSAGCQPALSPTSSRQAHLLSGDTQIANLRHSRLPVCATIFLAAGMWLAPSVPLSAATLPKEQVTFFEQKIRPLLVAECYECHSAQAKKVKGSLWLDSKPGIAKGGESGKPLLDSSAPEQSLLLKVVRHEIEDQEMPPKKKLTSEQIADLTTWVKLGAPDPREAATVEVKRGDKSWWSLQALAKVQPPETSDLKAKTGKVTKSQRTKFDFKAWQANPIDRYILAKLAEKDLQPNAPAERRALIRRVTYDVTGLPPTPEEVDAFIKDKSPDAYAKLVDRLLASPQYGERWGRHWLDIVRFGESNGFERNFIIDNAWPFRDYVIRSINEDKPFNQFIIEHLAGDVVGKDQPDIEIGSAFMTIGPYDDVGNQDVVAAANIRAATLDDMVTATGSAFLGLTINCARCHNHKFDPIPTEDYYRIKSVFEGVKHGPRVLATAEQRKQFDDATKPLNEERARLVAEKAKVDKDIAERIKNAPAPVTPRPAPSPRQTDETFAPVQARYVRFNFLATTSSPLGGGGGKLEEVQVWAGERNVALASNGAKAEGTKSREAKDFDNAYDVNLVNDGKFGARWFIGSPAQLTITLAQTETIDRITLFNNYTGPDDRAIAGATPFVTEYEVFTSLDGKEWKKAADSFDRKPFDKALADMRISRRITTDEDRKQIAELNKAIAQVDAKLRAIPALPTVWVGTITQPKDPTVVQKGGDPMKPADVVKPASLNVLERVTKPYELAPTAPEGERRLALAKWIVSDENPLSARVLVNRLWHYHFGTGIVDTPGDFGFLGGQPTHPELLDYLAHRLHANGWKLKAVHREILLSQTYQQSADFRESAARVDKDARFLWRFPSHRLDAEEVRDTMLAVTGKLDQRMGGPGFRLYEYKSDNVSTFSALDKVGPETYRRAVYHQSVRASVVDVLSDFDLPDNAFGVPRRANTTTPLQALTLLNHSFTLDMAAALAARVEKDAGKDDAAKAVQRAYALAFQRQPTKSELKAATKLISQYGLNAFCRALLNANELIYLE